MGAFTCILFAIIASWITSSVQPRWKHRSIWTLLVTGIAGGGIGCLAAVALNVAKPDTFNMYGVLIAIASSVLLTWAVSLRKRSEVHVAAIQAEIEEEEEE